MFTLPYKRSHKAEFLGGLLSRSDEVIPSACEEIDVVVAHSGADRCLLLSGATSSAVPHHVTRWERHASSPTGWSVVSRIRESRQRMPGEGTRKRARTLAARLYSRLDDVSRPWNRR